MVLELSRHEASIISENEGLAKVRKMSLEKNIYNVVQYRVVLHWTCCIIEYMGVHQLLKLLI